MAMDVLLWVEDEVIVSMPAMVANCLMSGVATEVAMVWGDAPSNCAETLTTGNSVRGKAASGRNP